MKIRFLEALNRKKTNAVDSDSSQLARVLSLLDLTALGVGSTLGLGVYVLAGSVAKTIAGPAVCISFLVAAVASAFAALCYAEFAAKVPKAGSAYIYSYVTIGEFVAFVIGWNLILEYVIGTASVARGLSNYVDALAGKKISNCFIEWMPMNVSFLAPYPDFLSFVVISLLTGLLAFGVKESSNLNNIFTFLNLATILIAIVAASIKADVINWKLTVDQIDADHREQAGTGGFSPFGLSGIMAGAARCFYGFIGFDAIATTGEEAKNPQKDIPLAIVMSLIIIFCAYFAISTVVTMAMPYYLQNADAPFPFIFEQFGWNEIKWVVTVGAIFALFTSLIGTMFPLPRILYAMSSDGLIFKYFSRVNVWTKTPLVATILSGLLSAVMATSFNLEQLIDMMSIGTLLAYSIVAVSILMLRYQEDTDSTNLDLKYPEKICEDIIKLKLNGIFNLSCNRLASKETSQIVNWSILLFCIFGGLFCATIANGHKTLFKDSIITTAFAVTLFIVLVLFIIIARQPKTVNLSGAFTVPLVPYIPCLSVMFNLYLMMELDIYTWIRFVIWLILGLVIYFFYGVSHSAENRINTSSFESTQVNKVSQ